MESKFLTCEAVVSTYSGQMLKYLSSRTDFFLTLNLTLPFPHPNSSKQDTEKQRGQLIVLVAYSSFSSRAENYPG